MSEKLWKSLKENGQYTKSYEDFQLQFNNEEGIAKLHEALTKSKDYTKSLEEFNAQFFSGGKPDDSAIADPNVESDNTDLGLVDGSSGPPAVIDVAPKYDHPTSSSLINNSWWSSEDVVSEKLNNIYGDDFEITTGGNGNTVNFVHKASGEEYSRDLPVGPVNALAGLYSGEPDNWEEFTKDIVSYTKNAGKSTSPSAKNIYKETGINQLVEPLELIPIENDLFNTEESASSDDIAEGFIMDLKGLVLQEIRGDENDFYDKLKYLSGDNKEHYKEKLKEVVFEQINTGGTHNISKSEFNRVLDGSGGLLEGTILQAKNEWLSNKNKDYPINDKLVGFERETHYVTKYQSLSKPLKAKIPLIKELAKLESEYINLSTDPSSEGYKAALTRKKEIEGEFKRIDAAVEKNAKGFHGKYIDFSGSEKELKAMYIQRGLTPAKAAAKASNVTAVKDTVGIAIATLRDKGDLQTDREILDLYYSSLLNDGLEITKSAKGKTVDLDVLRVRKSDKLSNLLIGKGLMDKSQRTGLLGLNSKIEISVNDLIDMGYSARDMDSFTDLLSGAIQDEDELEMFRGISEAIEQNALAADVVWDMVNLNIGVADVEKDSPITSFGKEVIGLAGGFLNLSDIESSKVGNLENAVTPRMRLDVMGETISNLNATNATEIKEGNISPINLTPTEQKNLDRTIWENTSEGLVDFVPIIIEMAAIEYATGGFGTVQALTGIKKIENIFKVQKGISAWDKAKYVGAYLVWEEAKMQTVGFKPTSGAAFGMGHLLTGGVGLKGKAAWLNPIFQKVFKGGVVGAGSVEFAQITELAWEDMSGVKDFGKNFDDLYGDIDEVGQRLLTSALTFGINGGMALDLGAGKDFYTTGRGMFGGKYKVIKDLSKKVRAIETEAEGRELTKKETTDIETLNSTRDDVISLFFHERRQFALDPKNENFEINFQKTVVDPINELLKVINPDHKGTEIVFTDNPKEVTVAGKEVTATFNPNNNKITFLRSAYTSGKPTHEITHLLLRAMIDGDPTLRLSFTNSMRKIFKDYRLGNKITLVKLQGKSSLSGKLIVNSRLMTKTGTKNF